MFTSFDTEYPRDLARRLEQESMPDSVYDLLVKTVGQAGSQPAWNFIDAGVTRTWAEVLEGVEETAAAFALLGIGKGTHVAIMAWNCEEFPLTWLALSRLQAVMVPINPTYTTREVEYALTTSDTTYMVIGSEFLHHLEKLSSIELGDDKLVVIDDDLTLRGTPWSKLLDRGRDHVVPSIPRSAYSLLNLQYTSGTTGFAKACMLSQEYWLVLGISSTELFGTTLRRYYQGSSFYYMIGQRILLNAMVSGGCVFVPRKPGAKRFMPDVVRYECDYCALFEMIYKQPPRPEDAANKLKIATVFAFAPENHSDFQKRFDVYAQEFYGMTEIGSGTYVPVQDLERMSGSGSCGVAAPFRELMVADAQGQPVALGEAGELCVRGRGIFSGYYRAPEATTESFRNGWFRTGDIARMDADGFYYILGRIKDMVRRSGENISAREIESVLRTMPEVEDAAVVPVPDSYRGEEVKVYIQLSPGYSSGTVPPAVIFAYCAERLAAFKIPRYIEYRESFPLTDSLRVKKKSLLAEKSDLRTGSFDRQQNVWL